MNQNRPILSVCIPTCNREEVAVRCVKDILEFKSNEIEVVVCDNGSVDCTFDRLKSINDDRLSVYRNEENIGFSKNFYRVIKEAFGSFVIMLSDEDSIRKDILGELLQFLKKAILEKDNIAGIIDNYDSPNKIITKKDEIINILYGRCSYISGLIFNRDKIIEEDLKCTITIYPHIYLLMKLALRGTLLFLEESIYYTRENSKTNEIGSYTSINERYTQMINEFNIISRLHMELDIKYEVMIRVFGTKISQGICGHHLLYKNDTLREYYKLEQADDYQESAQRFATAAFETIYVSLGKEYAQRARQFIIDITRYCLEVIQKREEYLSNLENGYKTIILGDAKKSEEYKKTCEEYNLKVDRCLEKISPGEYNKKDKLIILLCDNFKEYEQQITSMQLEECKVIKIDELRLYI